VSVQVFNVFPEWLKPRWSVVLFWAIDLAEESGGESQESAGAARQAHSETGGRREAGTSQDDAVRPDPGRALGASQRRVVQEFGAGAGPEEIIAVSEGASMTRTEVAERLTRGSHCVRLVEDGQIATTCWVSAGAEWLRELSGWFAPAPGDAYVWDCATSPLFRGRHLYPRLLREILRRLTGEGLRRAWIATEWHNWRSASGLTRAGFRPVGIVVAVHYGRWRWQHVIADPSAPPERVASLTNGLEGV